MGNRIKMLEKMFLCRDKPRTDNECQGGRKVEVGLSICTNKNRDGDVIRCVLLLSFLKKIT
jgi:hypothetical protein